MNHVPFKAKIRAPLRRCLQLCGTCPLHTLLSALQNPKLMSHPPELLCALMKASPRARPSLGPTGAPPPTPNVWLRGSSGLGGRQRSH